MQIQWEVLSDVLAGLIGGSVGGAITGAIVAHFLAKRRDADARRHTEETARENRKQDFIGLLREVRLEAEKLPGQPRFIKPFREKVSGLYTESPKISRDLDPAKRGQFNEAVERLCSLKDSEVLGQIGDRGQTQALIMNSLNAIEKSLG